MNDARIIVWGSLNPSKECQDRVRILDVGGVCQSVRATDYKDPPKIAIKLEQVGQLGGVYESTGRVYSPNGLCPTINTMGGGNREPKIVEPYIAAMRGRNPENPTSRKSGLPTRQMLEARGDGISNALTTVQKDDLVIEPSNSGLADGERVRKLTPRETWRLMGFTDEEFDKAKQGLNETHYKGRDRSNSQLYKQAGNSIVKQVLMAIFGEMVER